MGGIVGLVIGILDCFWGEFSFLLSEGILVCLMGFIGLSGFISSGLVGSGGLGGGFRFFKFLGRVMYDGLGGIGGCLGGTVGLVGS